MERPSFEMINRYAHKRKGINISNPALIWHKAYWKPKGENNDAEWHRSIDLYIDKTKENLSTFTSNMGVEIEFHDDRIPIPSAKEPITKSTSYPIQLYGSHISFRISDVRLSVVFEKFDEFWSVKAVLDFSYAAYGPMRLSFLESIHSDMSRIEDIVISRYNHREARLALDEVSRLQERALARTHISVISRSISEALNELHYALFPQNAGGNCEVPCDLDNNLFANFFGFSLGIGLPSGKKGIALPLSRKRATDVVNNISANCVFDSESDDQALDLIDAIWPVATDLNPYLIYGKAEQPRNFEPPRTTREFTISRLNRSRALYITSLGAIREIEQKGIYFPLAYLMISPHRATWQIGRIIDRIHTLGIFRLASFIEYDKIEDANNGMRMLIDRANKNADMDIQTLSGEFAKLGADIGNGLHYRIEWSRFYARLYHESIEMLTFERVEGYQTYKEFVVRKLSERFETIDGVARRFEHLSRLIQARVGQRTGSSIRDLLHFAEKISIVPIPYYLHSVLKDINDFGVFESINLVIVGCVGILVPYESWKIIWIVLSMAYIGNVLIVKSKSRLASCLRKPFIWFFQIASRKEHQPPLPQQPSMR